MKIKIKDGLIFNIGNVDPKKHFSFDCPMADQIARSNDFSYAEDFVKAHNGKTLKLNVDSLEIEK